MLSVSILLSTYNGSKFLREQLDSLLAQSFENYIIWVRDDGSIDNTKEIVEGYKKMYPEKFVLVDWNQSQNIGFAASFYKLLSEAKADLYFFCDQDDVWELNKLEIMISYYQTSNLKSIPCLLHSDLSFITEGNTKNTSFFDLTKYKLGIDKKVLFRGFIPGCSMAFNEPLRELCLKIGFLTSHDLMVYLIAQFYGKIILIDDKLIRYRLHQNNTVGLGKKMPKLILLKDIWRYLFNSKAYRDIILLDYFQLVHRLRLFDKNLIQKEIYNSQELRNFGFIERKKWYYNHFYPLEKGFIEGILILLVI